MKGFETQENNQKRSKNKYSRVYQIYGTYIEINLQDDINLFTLSKAKRRI
jgi:hypothetical protein